MGKRLRNIGLSFFLFFMLVAQARRKEEREKSRFLGGNLVDYFFIFGRTQGLSFDTKMMGDEH